MKQNKKILFRVGNRDIIENGLYALIGPSNTRSMVVAYNSKTNESTWVEPVSQRFTSKGDGLMAMVINVSLLEDEFDTSKPYLCFKGGKVEFDWEYKPTAEQIEILTNWYQELERAGIGGKAPEILDRK